MTDDPIEADFRPKLLPPQIVLRPTKNRNRANPLREAVSDYVLEQAFVCWVEGNRSVPQARKLYAERREGDAELPEIARQTWYTWVRTYEWHSKADGLIAQNFPALRMRHIARLVYSAGAALDFLIGSVQGEHDHLHPGTHKVRSDNALGLLVAGGLGTHGSKDRLAPVVRAIVEDAPDFSAMSELEINQWTRQKLAEGKAQVNPERRQG